MQHLESLSCDPSVKAADRSKLNGYLRKWKTTKRFVYSCFFVDLLQASATLSAAFQESEIDAMAAAMAMAKAKQQLTVLLEKMATMKHYLNKVQENCYQGIKTQQHRSCS